MEGISIYEESLKEINRILKTCTSSSFSINVDKLDANTKGLLLTAIQDVLHKRSKEVSDTVTGVF